jgi:hypothetical protein
VLLVFQCILQPQFIPWMDLVFFVALSFQTLPHRVFALVLLPRLIRRCYQTAEMEPVECALRLTDRFLTQYCIAPQLSNVFSTDD